MRLLYPENLWYLLGLLPLLLLFIYNYHRGRRRLRVLTGEWRSGSVYNVYLVKSFFSSLLLILFFSFAVLSVAGFNWGRRTVEDDRSGLDLVFAVDISRSMLAEDVSPSRLARARDAMRAAVRELEFARFSVVVFRGDAVTAVPMTEDSVAVENFLSALSVQMMTSPGTNLAAGVTAALEAFPAGVNRHRLVVLFSDGESVDGGNLEGVLQRVAKEEVPLFVVAAGTSEGARIPLGGGAFVSDEAGEPVVSRVDLAALRRLSQESGGNYFSLVEAGSISTVLRELESHYDAISTDGLRTLSVDRYRLFLGLALLSLALYVVLGSLRWRNLF